MSTSGVAEARRRFVEARSFLDDVRDHECDHDDQRYA
jgi:hypothetical protein